MAPGLKKVMTGFSDALGAWVGIWIAAVLWLESSPSNLSLADVAMGMSGAAILTGLVVMKRYSLAGFDMDPAGVTIRNPWRTHKISLGKVVGVESRGGFLTSQLGLVYDTGRQRLGRERAVASCDPAIAREIETLAPRIPASGFEFLWWLLGCLGLLLGIRLWHELPLLSVAVATAGVAVSWGLRRLLDKRLRQLLQTQT